MGVPLEGFAAEARAFLEAHLERRPDPTDPTTPAPEHIAIVEEFGPQEERAHVGRACAWQRTKFDAGYGWLTGPSRYGGRELPLAHEVVFTALEREYAAPDRTPLLVSLGMVAPTLLAHGTPVVQDRYLRDLHRGDVFACQLFSEPEAGSDLAGVATRAERDDTSGSWRLTGQKVWTSWSASADVGLTLARSDPQATRHRGLTMFLIDMTAIGVDVRPLRQMTGGAGFSEVFLDGVAVPDDHRIGEVGDGWRAAITTLTSERATISAGGADVPVGLLARALVAAGRQDEVGASIDLGRVARQARIHDLIVRRTNEGLVAGDRPGPELSAGKLLLTRAHQAAGALAASLVGPDVAADGGALGGYAWAGYLLGVPGTRIAGGTDEIQLDIIAERVLGLPREPRPT
ncbi:MAG: acyl-CoA dehydrogenase family protein [Actinobacteria bacterium]|nr:acyl-CoA dehydrogenase family protein [Actinomycetota bacterium]